MEGLIGFGCFNRPGTRISTKSRGVHTGPSNSTPALKDRNKREAKEAQLDLSSGLDRVRTSK